MERLRYGAQEEEQIMKFYGAVSAGRAFLLVTPFAAGPASAGPSVQEHI
jgi:hypothetical protein